MAAHPSLAAASGKMQLVAWQKQTSAICRACFMRRLPEKVFMMYFRDNPAGKKDIALSREVGLPYNYYQGKRPPTFNSSEPKSGDSPRLARIFSSFVGLCVSALLGVFPGRLSQPNPLQIFREGVLS